MEALLCVELIGSYQEWFNWLYNHTFLIENDGYILFVDYKIDLNTIGTSCFVAENVNFNHFELQNPCGFDAISTEMKKKRKSQKTFGNFKRSTSNVLVPPRYFFISYGLCHQFSMSLFLSVRFFVDVFWRLSPLEFGSNTGLPEGVWLGLWFFQRFFADRCLYDFYTHKYRNYFWEHWE